MQSDSNTINIFLNFFTVKVIVKNWFNLKIKIRYFKNCQKKRNLIIKYNKLSNNFLIMSTKSINKY